MVIELRELYSNVMAPNKPDNRSPLCCFPNPSIPSRKGEAGRLFPRIQLFTAVCRENQSANRRNPSSISTGGV